MLRLLGLHYDKPEMSGLQLQDAGQYRASPALKNQTTPSTS